MSVPQEPAELCTIRDFIRWGASEFARVGLVFGHGTDNALDEARFLVLHALRLPYGLPDAYLKAALTAEERTRTIQLLQERRDTRKPAAYLTGEMRFAGLTFEVDECVLIPRSPIAEMIERGFEPWLTEAPRTILDLCAGSGCIGIACACAFPEAEVDLAELDDGAVEVAMRNTERHGVADRVRVLRSDLFSALAETRYDLVVANPPYVPTAEWRALAPEYRHEPRMALEGGADGMDVVARILAEAPQHLSTQGTLICEIGGSQGEFERRFPGFPAIWPEFERGGDGVFIVSAAELTDWLRESAAGEPAPKEMRSVG